MLLLFPWQTRHSGSRCLFWRSKESGLNIWVDGQLLILALESRRQKLQVDIIHLQFLQARIDCFWYVFNVGYDFSSDEQFFSSYFTLFDRHAHLCFGIVCFGIIEVVVA